MALATLVLAASGYYVAVIIAASRFRSRKPPPASVTRPGVSILKPVRGRDPEFLECLRSHAVLDYPEFEIIFGVSGPGDPAIGPIKQFIREFPEQRIELLICDPPDEGNAKAASLDQIARAARHDVFLVTDGDVALEPDHLSHVVRELSQPNVGLVFSFYEARPDGVWLSYLEAALITADFHGQVLVAGMLQGVRFGLGASMLFRRQDIESVGGFSSLVAYIADDYEIGRRVAAAGRSVVMAKTVQTYIGADSWRTVWRRQLRWSRTIRAARPPEHKGLFLTNGTVWSLLLLSFAGSAPWAALACACLGLRLIAAWQVAGRTLRAKYALRHTLLALPADLLGFAVWAATFFVRRVFWRDRWLQIEGGRITKTEQAIPPHAASASSPSDSRSPPPI